MLIEVEKQVILNFDVRNACLMKINIKHANILCLVIDTKKQFKIETILNLLKKNCHHTLYLKYFFLINFIKS